MSDNKVTVQLNGTFRWNGVKYGPGKAVSVPAEMAEAFKLTAAKTAATTSAPADDRTVDELKTALDGAGVEYATTAKKADLLKLAADAKV